MKSRPRISDSLHSNDSVRPVFLAAAFFFLCVLFDPEGVRSRPGHLLFENIGLDEGLSHNTVTCILQDREGFLWFGTQDGLNRYDGYNMTVYRHEAGNPDSPGGDFILDLYEDTAGTIWIGAYEGGLTSFDPAAGTFTRHEHDPEDPASIGGNNVAATVEDGNGHIWIGLRSGLDRLDPRTGDITHFTYDASDPDGIGGETVFSLLRDGDSIWVGTTGGLDRLDLGSLTFEHFRHDPADPSSLSEDTVHGLFMDDTGILWVGTEGGLNRLDPATGACVRFRHDPDDPASISDDIVFSILDAGGGLLWLGTSYGLDLFDPAAGTVRHTYRHDPLDARSISSTWIKQVFRDRAGVYWFATDNGVAKYVPRKSLFHHYRHEPMNPSSLSGDYIAGFAEEPDGSIWIATRTSGVNRYDPASDTFIRFRHDPDDPGSLASDWTESIYRDREGTVWVGTGVGLCRFDRESSRFTTFRHDDSDGSSLSDDWVLTLREDFHGDFWVGTGHGLNRMDRASGAFTRYYHDDNDPHSLSHSTVRHIFRDNTGAIWVGTDRGLNRYDRDSDSFDTLHFSPHDENCLCTKKIFYITRDMDGDYWIGTDDGLIKYDTDRRSFIQYGFREEALNGVVNGILEDGAGRLWISTFRGITMLDPESWTIRNFDSRDGLQGNQFNAKACLKTRQGELFFGGRNGFNRFYPQDIRDNPHVPHATITAFRSFDRDVAAPGTVSADTTHHLDHTDNFITFEFVALDFSTPGKNRFSYHLDGLDEGWVHAGNRRNATYTNLSPGNYVFRVRAANSDGRWSDEEATVAFRIVPPLWGTGWFRALMALLLAGAAYGIHHRRMVGLKRQRKRLEDEVSSRTAELRRRTIELNDERQRLFAVLDALPALVFLQNGDRSLIFSNLMVEKEFGGREMIPCHELFMNTDTPCESCSVSRVLETGRPCREEWKPRNGRTYQLHRYPFPDVDGSPMVLSLAMDITDRMQAETERLAAEKLRAVLETAGATSHEVTQPLQIISGHVELMLMQTPVDSEVRSRLEKIRSQVERMSETTLKLQNITRYKTKDYASGNRIIDIDGASE